MHALLTEIRRRGNALCTYSGQEPEGQGACLVHDPAAAANTSKSKQKFQTINTSLIHKRLNRLPV